MREILFRAKRIDNNEWGEGDLRQDRDLEIAYISGWDYYTTDGGLEREPFEYEIDSETLCQFTGMADKNGKRIWENDIVQTPFRRFVVTYFDGVWGDRDGVAMRESIFGEGGVVIGNVFDNPELMEQEKETEV